MAGLTAGAVGTFAFLQNRSNNTSYNFGEVANGSDLYPAGTPDSYQNSARSGTWRCLGYCPAHAGDPDTYYASLFIRIT